MAPLAALISLVVAWAGEPTEGHGRVEHHAAAGELVERAAAVSVRDVKVPRALIDRLEADFKRERGEKAGAPKRALLNLAVEFRQRPGEEGALEESASYRLPAGGGVLDLAGIVNTRRAAFNVRPVPRDPEGATEVAVSRVYFISRAVVRRLDGETFGDGCGKVLDLTSAFRERFGRRGFDVYSAERRYLTTLGGTFLFARFDQSALQVASVTFTDSRYPQLVCE